MSFFLYAVQVLLSEAVRATGLDSAVFASTSNPPGYTHLDDMDTSDEHSNQVDRFKSISISDEPALQSSSIESNNPSDPSDNQYIPYNDLFNAIQPLCNDNRYATAIPDAIISDTGEPIYLISEDFALACQTYANVCYQNTLLIYMAFIAIETNHLSTVESDRIAMLNRIPTDFVRKKSAMKKEIDKISDIYVKFANLPMCLSPQTQIESFQNLFLARKKQMLLEKIVMEFVDNPLKHLDVIRKIHQETNHFYQLISLQYEVYEFRLLPNDKKEFLLKMLDEVEQRIETLPSIYEIDETEQGNKLNFLF